MVLLELPYMLKGQIDGQAENVVGPAEGHGEGKGRKRTPCEAAKALTCWPGDSSHHSSPLPVPAPPLCVPAVSFAFKNFGPSAEPSPRRRRCHGGSSAALQGRVPEALLVWGSCRRRRGL